MNKPYALLVLCLLLSFTTLAQTDQGTWLVGLSGNGFIDNNRGSRSTRLQLAPQAGYFVARNLVLGGQLLYEYNKRSFDGRTTVKSNQTNAQTMLRYYVGNGKLKPYASLLAGYAWNRGQGMDVNGNPITFRGEEGRQTAIGGGLAYFVAPKVALEAEAHYRFLSRSKIDSDINATTFRLGVGLYLGR